MIKRFIERHSRESIRRISTWYLFSGTHIPSPFFFCWMNHRGRIATCNYLVFYLFYFSLSKNQDLTKKKKPANDTHTYIFVCANLYQDIDQETEMPSLKHDKNKNDDDEKK